MSIVISQFMRRFVHRIGKPVVTVLRTMHERLFAIYFKHVHLLYRIGFVVNVQMKIYSNQLIFDIEGIRIFSV